MLNQLCIKNSKKIAFTVIAILFSLVLIPAPSYAKEVNPQNNNIICEEITGKVPNIGVTEICPDDISNEEITPYGTSIPSSVWNIKNKGRYDFSGSAKTVTIYTSYKFKGKTSYTFYVKNTGSYSISVKAKTRFKTYASTNISAGKSASVTFSDIDSSTEFYLRFEGSTFSGYIK